LYGLVGHSILRVGKSDESHWKRLY